MMDFEKPNQNLVHDKKPTNHYVLHNPVFDPKVETRRQMNRAAEPGAEPGYYEIPNPVNTTSSVYSHAIVPDQTTNRGRGSSRNVKRRGSSRPCYKWLCIFTILVFLLLVGAGATLLYLFTRQTGINDKDASSVQGPTTTSHGILNDSTEVQIKPQWARWSSWSDCSVSCNSGVRERQRSCEDPVLSDGITCAGQPTESEVCATWNCPDCSKICTHGVLNADCDACDCSSSLLSGRVTDLKDNPLSDVFIAYTDRPYQPLASTDSAGRFSVSSVCAVAQNMTLTKSQFSSSIVETQVIDTWRSNLEAKLHRLEVPLITDHPRNKVRFTGQSVSFCCTAESDPPPNKYEWFKDGDILEQDYEVNTTMSILTLRQLSIDDSGIYTCRVRNEGGSVFSEPAVLDVTTSSIECSSQPIQDFIELPPDCLQLGTNLPIYDVGTCRNTECTGQITQQTQCKDPSEETYCCQSLQTETVNIICQGYTLPVSRVVTCGCVKCLANPTQVGGEITSAESGEPLDYISVYYNGKVVVLSDNRGRFSFEISSQTSRVSLTFTDGPPKRVMDNTVVLQIQQGSLNYRTIKMKPQAPEMTVPSSQENCLTVVGNDSHPIAEVVLPPNSMYNSNGDPYTGNVKVRINNIDMRDEAEAEIAPGDFSSINEDGDRMMLKSFGMFSVDFKDESENPMSIGGKAKVMVDPSMIPGCDTADGVCTTKVWILNQKSGSWDELGPLAVSETFRRRRKRQAPVLFAGIEIEVSNANIYNIDDLAVEERCWGKVIPYESDKLMNALSNSRSEFQVTTIVKKDQDDFFQRAQDNSIGTSRHGDGVCVAIPCDNTNQGRVAVSISASFNGNNLLPAATNTPYFALDSQDRSALNYEVKDVLYIHFKPQRNLIVSSPDGPIFYGTDAGKTANGVCSTADIDDKHFQFHKQTEESFCFNYNRPNQQLDRLTFYPQLKFKQSNVVIPVSDQRFCFIGVKIETSFEHVLTVLSVSTVGSTNGFTVSASDPQEYGRRQVNVKKPPNSRIIEACMEFKCEGIVFNYDRDTRSQKSDKTKVTIDVHQGQQCRIKGVRDAISSLQSSNIQMNQVLPVWFIDEALRGAHIYDHDDLDASPDAQSCNDAKSPQDKSTFYCRNTNGVFNSAFDVICE